MLCPETWRFAPPKSNYKEHKRNFIHENTIPSVLFDFHYTHFVSIVLPNILHKTPITELKELLSVDCEYYKVEDVSLAEFLTSEFIEKFIKCGELSALSVNTRLDLDNCVCVTPEGILVLHLDKETYQGLGLEGKISHFANQQKNKYIVEIKLKSVTGKARIERMRKSLSERLNKFTLILSWHPPQHNICPSSIAKYLSNLGYNIYLCEPKHLTRNSTKVKVPILPSFTITTEDVDSELIEWLGMFSLDADLTSGKYDNFVNTYECPEENITCENVTYLEWRGFYTKQKIQNLYQYLTKYVQTLTAKNKVPWISLYVQGFCDAPVSWNLTENHFFTNSENAYGIFMKPDGNYLLCTQLCSNKRQK